MKKIFGHIYLFDLSSPFLGRSVADRDFLAALIRYGTFDEYHFFAEGDRIMEDFRTTFGDVIRESGKGSWIRLFYLSELDKQLTRTSYTVFHATDPLIDRLLYMRDNFVTTDPFPVTGYTHTLSSRNLAPGFFLTLLHRPRTYDAIICSSRCGQQVMKNIFEQYNRDFQQSYGTPIAYKGQLPHIPIGINLQAFNQISKAEARRILGFSQDNPILLSIARLTPSSKMDYYPLIDVFSAVLSDYPSARLVLAGGLTEDKGDYLKELQQYAFQLGLTDQIILYPNFEPGHKHLLYSAADIFVSPSDNLQETFGITIIEALASGLPVVCSDWDGYKELIEDGITGYKIPTIMQRTNRHIEATSLFSLNITHMAAQLTAIDQAVMKEKLLQLLINNDERAAMSRQALQKARDYDWAQLIPRYEELWLTLKQQAAEQQADKQFSLHFPMHSIFSHYPTRILNDADMLSLTQTGDDILHNKRELSVNQIMKAYLDFQLLGSILLAVKKQAVSTGQLKSILPAYEPEQIEGHILWLIKNGALSIT